MTKFIYAFGRRGFEQPGNRRYRIRCGFSKPFNIRILWTICRGTLQRAPTMMVCVNSICHAPTIIIIKIMQNYDTMYMIRHHDKFIQFNIRSDLRRTMPFFVHNISNIIHLHLGIDDLAKQTSFMLHTNGKQISARLFIP